MSVNSRHVRAECARFFAAIPLLLSLDLDGKKVIAETLERHCQSDEHVTRVLQTFAETVADWRNPVAELVSIAHATRTAAQPPPGCDRCFRGADAETGVIRWAPHVIVIGKNGQERGADRCNCARGDWLRQRDKEQDEQRKRELSAHAFPAESEQQE